MSPNATPAGRNLLHDAFTELVAVTPDWHPTAAPTVGDLVLAATAPPRYHLLDLDELAAKPPPTWLLDSMIVKGGFSCLYGQSGGGKSFLALDWGLSVAYGRPWAEHQTQPGAVVYIAGEGTGGLAKRVEAWRAAHGVSDPAPFYTLPDAVNFLDEGAAAAVLAALTARQDDPPALVIVDTLARSMAGGDENSTRDMSTFIANLDKIRHTTGAAVLVIHHTGKNGGQERGSSSLRGGADTMIALDSDDGVIRLTCDKQRDAPPFDPSAWQLTPYADSCILAPATASTLTGTRGTLSPAQHRILETLAGPILTGGASIGEIGAATDLPTHQIYKGLNALDKRGLLDIDGPPKSHNRRYRASTAGAELIGLESSLTHTNSTLTVSVSQSAHTPTLTLTHTNTPFMGVSVSQCESVPGSESTTPAGQEHTETNGPAPSRYSAPPLSAPPKPTDSGHACADPGCDWLWLRTGGWVRTCWDRKHLAERSAAGGR